MKKIAVVLFAIIALSSIGYQPNADEENHVDKRVHGDVKYKVTKNPLHGFLEGLMSMHC